MRQEGNTGEEDEDDGKNREYDSNDFMGLLSGIHLLNRSLGAYRTLGGVWGVKAFREAGVGKA